MPANHDHGARERVANNGSHAFGFLHPPSWLRSLGLNGLHTGLSSYASTLARDGDGETCRLPDSHLQGFIQQACEQLVGQLGVYNIWIALFEKKDVIAVASSFHHGFNELKEQLLGGGCPHCMRQVKAREGIVVVEDPRDQCGNCPLAHSYHGRIGMAMRLHDGARLLGMVCASVPDVMVDEEDLRARMQDEVDALSKQVAAIMDREEWMRTEAMVHSIYRAAPVGIGLIRAGTIREVNDTLCTMTGRSRFELIGAAFATLSGTAEEARRIRAWMEEATSGRNRGETETRWSHPAGRELTIRLCVTPLDLADPAKGITFSALDITSQKQAELNLKESRRMLASLMDSLPGMAYRCRFDEHWTMEFVSRGCRELTGYEPEDVLGNHRISFARIIHEEDRDKVARDVADTAGQDCFTLEYRIVRADGEERWVWERGRMVPHQGEGPPMIEGFIIDITDRKQLDDHILQITKSESLSVMAGGIAHDFNNILAVMIGNAELGLQMVTDRPDVRDCLKRMIASGDRASELCRQLLSFCGNRFEEATVQVNELVATMMPLLKTTVGAGMEIRTHLAEMPMSAISADTAELRQLLVQLVANAAESYKDRRGVVEIHTGETACNPRRMPHVIGIDQPAKGRFVWIRVVDHGCGIDDETKQRMFDPFFSTKFTGRGMGLAAVRGVVQAHKGFITVETGRARGTSLTVYLPVQAGETSRSSQPEKKKSEGRVSTVLVVEDEEGLSELIGHMLRNEGIESIHAGDGLKAIDIYREHGEDIDLVLMDLTMPGLDGIEAARRLRAIRPEVRIILTTGYSKADITNRVDADILDGILLKPFTKEQLVQLLHA